MLLIAHRGDTVNHKENTLDAFVSAFEKGADGVEQPNYSIMLKDTNYKIAIY